MKNHFTIEFSDKSNSSIYDRQIHGNSLIYTILSIVKYIRFLRKRKLHLIIYLVHELPTKVLLLCVTYWQIYHTKEYIMWQKSICSAILARYWRISMLIQTIEPIVWIGLDYIGESNSLRTLY